MSEKECGGTYNPGKNVTTSSGQSDFLVSVLIGARDRYQPLLRCLRSILSQDYPKLEVLILDDFSQSCNVCNMIMREITNLRVKCFRSERQLGVAGGRNFLMQEAAGEVLVIVDDDAVFGDERFLSRVVAHFRANHTVGIIATRIVDHRDGRERLLLPFSRRWRKRRPDLIDRSSLVSYYVGGCHAMRREVIDTCGLYQENLMYGEEELDLAYRVVQAGIGILYAPDLVIHHWPEPSAVGTEGKRADPELYYHMRNRVWLAYKYLPIRFWPSYLSIWLCYYAILGVRRMQLGAVFRGLYAGVSGIRQLQRTPLDERSIAYLKENFGRLWY